MAATAKYAKTRERITSGFGSMSALWRITMPRRATIFLQRALALLPLLTGTLRLEEFYAYALDMHISLREFASFYHLKLTSRQLRQATAVTRVTKEDRHLRARLEAFLPEA